MKTSLTLLACIALFCFLNTAQAQIPSIASFSPGNGPVGSTLAITGTNFSATPADNIVYFGSVRGTVTAASATALSVTVPAGFTYDPISVTVNNLTAYSSLPFIVSFSTDDPLTSNTFVQAAQIADVSSPVREVGVADFNIDGKPDLAVVSPGPAMNLTSVVILNNNTGAPGIASFVRDANLTTEKAPTGIVTDDFDGDGKPDIAIVNFGNFEAPAPPQRLSVYLNTTSGSAITFAPKIDFVAGARPNDVISLDADRDGKPDLVVSNGESNTLSIFRNTSTGVGNIAFDTRVDIATPMVPSRLCKGDFDGDGQVDVAVISPSVSKLIVYRNICSPGTMAFAAGAEFPTGIQPEFLSAGDIDNDGKIDLITNNNSTDGRTLSLFRNTGTSGNISFAAKMDISGSIGAFNGLSIADLDGDAKVDILAAASFRKNTSTTGTFSFADPVPYSTRANEHIICSADIDIDGKTDLINAYPVTGELFIYRNRSNEPYITSFTPTAAGPGATISIIGQNLAGTTAVSFGGTPATSFYVNTDTNILAVVSDGSSGDVTLTTASGVVTSSGFNFTPVPTITSFAPLSGPVGTSVTINGTNFSATRANNIVYFGAVKAEVTAASATSLTVMAPAGATFSPITVTVNGLTAYSAVPFKVTFNNGQSNHRLSASSFGGKTDFAVLGVVMGIVPADFDGDGKPDLGITNNLNSNISVLRNTTTAPGVISFDTRLDLATEVGPYNIHAGDLDGDGKPDLALSYLAPGVATRISFFRNTSTVGNVSFGTRNDLDAGNITTTIQIRDLDGDGKPEIVALTSQGIAIYRNTSVGGTISFGAKMDLATGINATKFVIADLDDDLKPDLAVSNMPGNTSPVKLTFYKNNSAPGSIAFGFVKEISTSSSGRPSVFAGDMDMDGKIDLGFGYSNLEFFRNTGSYTFANIFFLFTEGEVTGGMTVDLNGDAKPDLARFDADVRKLKLATNLGSSGVIAYSSDFTMTDPLLTFSTLSVADLDLDGKPELISSTGTGVMTVLRNQINEPVITSFAPTTAESGDVITITGENFADVNAVNFGGIPAASFTVASPTSITAVVGEGTTGSIAVTSPLGTSKKEGFTYVGAPPAITSFSPLVAPAGTTVTIKGTQLHIVTGVSFGGTTAASFTIHSSSEITAVVADGSSGDITLAHALGTASKSGFIFLPPPTITSFTPTSASKGNSVTIKGTNFINVSAVTVGNIAAQSFEVVDVNSIVAVVASAATGDVSVTTPAGTATLAGFTFIPAPFIASFEPESGAPGTLITITGEYFSDVTAVSLGNTPAVYTVVSSTSIVAIVGDGATGDVSVTTSNGSASLAGFTFTGAPAITSFAPQSGSPETVITITGKRLAGATAVTFGGVEASFTIVSPTTITAVVGEGATGSVVVTTPAGVAELGGFTYIPVLDLEHTSFDSWVSVSPNPSDGKKINLTLQEEWQGSPVSLTLADVTGKQLTSLNTTCKPVVEWELADAFQPPAGVYVLTVLVRQHRITRKVIIK